MVAVVDDRGGFCVVIHTLELCKALKNEADGNLSGTNDRDDLVKIGDPCACGEVVHDYSDRNVERSARVSVGVGAQHLKRLGVEDIDKLVKGSVGVAYIEEEHRLLPAENADIEAVGIVEYCARFGKGERLKGAVDELVDTSPHLVGNERAFDLTVLFSGKGIGIIRQPKLKRGAAVGLCECAVKLADAYHALLLGLQRLKTVGNQKGDIACRRFLPEGLVAVKSGHDGVRQRKDVLLAVSAVGVATNAPEGVVAV